MLSHIELSSSVHCEFIEITDRIQRELDEFGVSDGVCYVFVPHTTAAVTINEGADPSVKGDIQTFLAAHVPHSGDYKHMEGNSDAHIKATLLGSSETIFVEGGRLALGTWQSIYFCEFDGPRTRRVYVRFIKA
ncbi:MAG: YjbQ family protein [Proteobacteria bacterium]|nr:YjbQ family protein [Pseudomonadota bacterium]